MLHPEQRAFLLDIANAGCHNGLILEAREIYDGVLADSPGFAPALIGRAMSHIVVDEFAEAERILKEEVLSTRPEDADALTLLGLAALLAKRPEEAREILKPLAGKAGAHAPFAGELLELAGKA